MTMGEKAAEISWLKGKQLLLLSRADEVNIFESLKCLLETWEEKDFFF